MGVMIGGRRKRGSVRRMSERRSGEVQKMPSCEVRLEAGVQGMRGGGEGEKEARNGGRDGEAPIPS